MRQHQSLPEYKNGRYLKLAIGTCIWHEPPTVYLKPYGGTWPGYTFGTVLILWLMLPGVRKRGYRSGTCSHQGRTSAHVYIGTSLPVIVTLHAAFQFGWNVHTAAYALMVLAIRQRFHRRVAYLHCPALMTANPGEEQVETIIQQIANIDHKCRRMALDLSDEVNAIVMKASRASLSEPRIRTRFRRRFAAWKMRCSTREPARR